MKTTAFFLLIFAVMFASCEQEIVITHSITLTAGMGGTAMATIGGNEVTEVAEGAEITLTAIPHPDYIFDKWTADSEAGRLINLSAATTFIMPGTDVDIRADFKPDGKYTITVSSDGNGTVAATVDGEKVVKATAGAAVTLTATPADGYLFNIWTTENPEVAFESAGAMTTTFIMPAENVDIAASFSTADVFDVFVKITDPIFKEHCQHFDSDGNGVLSLEEANAVKNINVYLDGIESLAGIEYFENLEYLTCSGNKLTSLDVSGKTKLQELTCDYNQLTSLDVSGCPALVWLICNNNMLTSLDLSDCPALKVLYVYDNLLESLDISGCRSLARVNCNANRLVALDLSACTALQEIDCQDNQLLVLNLSKNRALTKLNCENNRLISLDVSGCWDICSINCFNNQLPLLDISKNKHLSGLLCYNNCMDTLDITDMAFGDSYGTYMVLCGNQVFGDTPRTLTLTMREDQEALWNSMFAKSPLNYNVTAVVQ